jgi:sulfate adenylyltransferase
LPASGKTRIGKSLQVFLEQGFNRTVTFLDGDEMRALLSPGLGFSKTDRSAHIKRVGFIAGEIVRHRGIAVCAVVAPYAEQREVARRLVEPHGAFIVVHVATTLALCEARDPKGLYARARAGLVSDFTGVNAPYEPPHDAALVLDGGSAPPECAAECILRYLQDVGCLMNHRGAAQPGRQ